MFTVVELVYGILTNSLGLLSDSFHMLFDCSALVIGLYASVISKWRQSRVFPYGYARFEVISGYINGLFLCVIAFYIFTEAISRMISPPEVKTDKLLLVSTLGLLVNLFGLLMFGHHHHGHSHDHDHGHGHCHGHGHSHDHGHSHSEANMRGVFLHVLADTLGSVGVIISSLLIEYFGWKRADPICSLVIAALIVLSVIPLLEETASILVLRTPHTKESQIAGALHKLLEVDGVIGLKNPHFWKLSDAQLVSSVRLIARHEANEQAISTQALATLKSIGIKSSNCCVQVEKEDYSTATNMISQEDTPLITKISQITDIPVQSLGHDHSHSHDHGHSQHAHSHGHHHAGDHQNNHHHHANHGLL